MTVLLPQPIPANGGWTLVDWLDASASSTPAGADGIATITLDQLDTATRWQLTHMVAFCTSSGVPQMRLYLNGVTPGNLRDGTSTGVFDVADWPMGLMVPPSAQLVAQWTGCNPGDVATLTVQGNVYQRTS